MSLIAFPTSDLITTLTANTPDPLYPALNAINDDSEEGGVTNPSKSTGASIAYTLSTPATVPEALFLINHNWAGNTECKLDGLDLDIPPRTADGQCVNAWADLRGAGIAALATHDLHVDFVPTGVASIGRIFLAAELVQLDVLWEVKFREQWLDNPIITIGGKRQVYNKGIKNRALEGTIITSEAQEILLALAQATQGRNIPFPLVPWPDRNDVLWVTFIENSLVWEEDALAVRKATIAVEQWMGLPL